MSEMSPQRRKVVVLCASVAAMSGVGPVLLKGHPKLVAFWLGIVVVVLVYAVMELVKLKGQGR